MASSARRPKPKDSNFKRGAAMFGAFVSDNPVTVGGSTALLVTTLYVSANALWYQPHAHTGPLFATRAFETFVDPQTVRRAAEPQTTFRIERPEQAPERLSAEPEARRALADPAVSRVQEILKDLAFYQGEVDGLKGPGTRAAIEAYQRKMDLEVTGQIDSELMEQLGANDTTGAIAPVPQPAVRSAPAKPPAIRPASDAEMIKKIQHGLRAFGQDIDIDGMTGAKTRAAVKEFQSLFGLKPTGEPDAQVYEKMREAKLVN